MQCRIGRYTELSVRLFGDLVACQELQEDRRVDKAAVGVAAHHVVDVDGGAVEELRLAARAAGADLLARRVVDADLRARADAHELLVDFTRTQHALTCLVDPLVDLHRLPESVRSTVLQLYSSKQF